MAAVNRYHLLQPILVASVLRCLLLMSLSWHCKAGRVSLERSAGTEPFWNRARPHALMMARRFGYATGGALAMHHMLHDPQMRSMGQFPVTPLSEQEMQLRRNMLYGILTTDQNFGDALSMDDFKELLARTSHEGLGEALVRAMSDADQRVEDMGAKTHQTLLTKNQEVFGPFIGQIVTELLEQEMAALFRDLPGVHDGERTGTAIAQLGMDAARTAEEVNGLVHDGFAGAGAHLWKIVQLVETLLMDTGTEVASEAFEEVAEVVAETKNVVRVVKWSLDLKMEYKEMRSAMRKLREADSPEAQTVALSELAKVISKTLLSFDLGLPEDLQFQDENYGYGYSTLRAKLHQAATAADAISSLITFKYMDDGVHFLVGEEDITADVEAIRHDNFKQLDKEHFDRILQAAHKALMAGSVLSSGVAKESFTEGAEKLKRWQKLADSVLPDEGPLLSVISVKEFENQPHLFVGGENVTADMQALHAGQLDHFDKQRIISLLAAANKALQVGSALTTWDTHESLHKSEEYARVLRKLADTVLPEEGPIITTKMIDDRQHFFIGVEDVTADIEAVRTKGLLGKDGVLQNKEHVDNLLSAASKALRAGAILTGESVQESLRVAAEHVDHVRDVAEKIPESKTQEAVVEQTCSVGNTPEQCLANTYFSSANMIFYGLTGSALLGHWPWLRDGAASTSQSSKGSLPQKLQSSDRFSDIQEVN